MKTTMQTSNWQCRVANSLGNGFAGTVEDAWGTLPYTDDTAPTCFFGLYGLPDFYALWRHKGRKAILWAGSDIRHFKDGYWLDEVGDIRLNPTALADWINRNCENYVENGVEQKALRNMGILSKVVPSFLGNVDDYSVNYEWSDRPKVYASVSGDDFKLYKWDKIEELAVANPEVAFHLYGNTQPWSSFCKNITVHGRVPQEQMNSEIKDMQGGLRLLDHDGFSEVIAKSLLWGQYPISTIPYHGCLSVDQIATLKDKTEPNHKGREWLLSVVNKYPWAN